MCCFVRRYEQRFDADAYHGDDDGTVFVHDHTLVGVGVFFFFLCFLIVFFSLRGVRYEVLCRLRSLFLGGFA